MSIFVSLLVCGATGLYFTEGQQLVSLGKPITISSPLSGWPVQNAVDGKSGTTETCICCAATSNDVTEYWYLLDLEQLYEIVRIDVLGRTDFSNFLNNMEISVGGTEDSLISLVTTGSTTIREYNYTLSPVRSARYVNLTRHVADYFVVCELSVYAACQDGTYGQGCQDTCGYCKDGAPCDSVNGKCDECRNTHFMMPFCKVCADDWYGPNCTAQCGHCSGNDVCNKDNGNCPNNCDAGYQGGKCDQDCKVGSYGSGCSQTCGRCNNDTHCNHITGICASCKTGFLDPMCQVCVDGRYGPDCGSSCGQCAGTGTCDKGTGSCPSGCNAGFQGDKCDTDCNTGSYGLGCSQTCGECNNDDHCNHITGMCASCKTGFLLPMCQDCVDGRYGPECGSSCGQCAGTGTCDKGTGKCPSGCNAGYQGDKCDQECGHGRFGQNCNESCGNCFNSDVCSKIDGACPHLCAAGYMGDTCHSPCSQGKYGQNCLYYCGNCHNKTPCMADSGVCLHGCAEGFNLPHCAGCEVEQEQAASSVVAVSVFGGVVGVLGLLVILSVVVIIVLIRRTSTFQKEHNPDQPETTNRYDTPLDISSQYGNNQTQPDPGQYEMLSGDRVQRAVPYLDYETLKPDDVNYEN